MRVNSGNGSSKDRIKEQVAILQKNSPEQRFRSALKHVFKLAYLTIVSGRMQGRKVS